MFDYKIILVLIGSIISIASTMLYIIGIVKKEIKPHVYSFLLWTILTFVGFLGSFFTGGGIGSFVQFILSLTTFMIFLLSLKYGHRDLTRLDKIALSFAFFAIVLWIFLKTPLYSIILITIIDFCGYFPTLNKLVKYPNTEKIINWLMFALANILGILALDKFSITTMMYPSMIALMNLAVVLFIIYFRKNEHK